MNLDYIYDYGEDLDVGGPSVKYTATDAKTKALNKRALLGTLKMFLWKTKSGGNSMTLVYIDVNDLQSFNLNYGRDAGDELLQHLVEAIKENIRVSDVIGRVSGDEFVVLLMDCERNVADARMSSALKKLKERYSGEMRNKASFSHGCVESRGGDGNSMKALEALIQLGKSRAKRRH